MGNMVSNNSKIKKIQLKSYKIISVILTVAIVILAIVFVPMHLPFWQFTKSDIVILLISLLIIALFIERAVEVIIIAWRGKGKQQIISVISLEKKKSEREAKKGVRKVTEKEDLATKELEGYSAETKNLALLIAFALGIIVSALGARAIQPLVDPAVFKTLGSAQKALFTGIDILITGALLGGGSEGIHKIVDSILISFEKYRKGVKEQLR